MISNSNDEIISPHKLLLTNKHVPNLCKGFANNLLVNIKLSKTKLSKKIQAGGLLSRLPRYLLKTGLALIKNALKTLAESALIP